MELLEALARKFGNRHFTAGEVNREIKRASMNDSLYDAFDCFSNGSHFLNTKSIGKILSYRTDRIAGDYVLKKGKVSGNIRIWRVIKKT